MRQPLADHWYWTFDLDSAFSRRETEDGFVVFEREGMEIWAVVYCEQPFDPREAVSDHRDDATPSEYPFPGNDLRIAGDAVLEKEDDGWRLRTLTASYGDLATLDFVMKDRDELDSALDIWRSLECDVPDWILLCAESAPPLRKLREALEDGSRVEGAVDEIEQRNQSAEAIRVLLLALESTLPTLRQSSCEVLGMLADDSPQVLNALRSRLDDEVVQVRAWAAEALLDLGVEASEVVPSMIEGLQKVERPMPHGGSRIQGICSHLSCPDRYHAARILSEIGEAARPARPFLLDAQMDESGDVRLRVAEALVNLGEPLASVLAPLQEGFRNPTMCERERMEIATALFRHGVPAGDLLPALVLVVGRSSDHTARVYALELLGAIGLPAQSASEAVVDAIDHEQEEWGIKIDAALSLARMQRRFDVALPILVSALEEEEDIDPYAMAEIIDALRGAESLDEDVLDRVVQFLQADDPFVRLASATTLAASFGRTESLLKSMLDLLDDVDEEIRSRAAASFCALVSTEKTMAPALIEMTRNGSSDDVKLAAAWALGRIGVEASQAAEVKALLIELASDDDAMSKEIVDEAIRRIDASS